MAISAKLRALVKDRAQHQCEYCRVSDQAFLAMTIDHIYPVSLGGKTDLDNLGLACGRCNEYKHAHITGFDPETQDQVTLFNPRTQNWEDHFTWSDDYLRILGLTSIGRATIDRLKMNNPKIILARQGWIKAEWHPYHKPKGISP